MTEHLCRRTVLQGAAAAAGSCLLAACGGGSDDPTVGATTGSDGTSPSSGAGSGGSSSSSGSGGKPLAALDDIEVGKAISAKAGDQPILLVRTSETEVTGLSAVCTHQRCTVAPEGDQLKCPCHGSEYDLTGKVTQGPAPRALDPFPVSVVDGSIVAS